MRWMLMLFLATHVLAGAQTAPEPRFEVASVKPNKDAMTGVR